MAISFCEIIVWLKYFMWIGFAPRCQGKKGNLHFIYGSGKFETVDGTRKIIPADGQNVLIKQKTGKYWHQFQSPW